MLVYTKLWILLENKGMKKTDLKEVISANTLAKLGKNEVVSSLVIEKICAFLDCQPGDIMEYINEGHIKEAVAEMDKMNRAMMEQMKARGITEEQFATMMQQVMERQIKGLFNGENVLSDIMAKVEEEKEKNS